VFTVDADLDYGVEHVGKFLEAAQARQADVIVGSPYCPGGQALGVPRVRLAMSRAMNWYFARVLMLGVSTYTSIARLYRKDALDRLLLVSHDKDLLPEILVKARLLKMHIVEMPATLRWRDARTARRGKGLGITSTARKAIGHLLLGTIENPRLFFAVPAFFA